MDPVTQGTLGAALPAAVARREQIRAFAWVGALAGMSPDLDVLIFSLEDPLLFLEHHRGFTHSLVFIPIGAGICALALFRWFPSLGLPLTYLAALLGYATHALLDACTAYGTQLFWPFLNTRFAWNNISIIDPLFTLPLLTLVMLSVRRKMPVLAMIGLAWALAYLLLGVVQNQRAIEATAELASSRGHTPEQLDVNPSFANIVLWRSIYRYQGRYYVDAIRTGLAVTHCEGESVEALVPERHLPWLQGDMQQQNDLDRFSWFAIGMLALDPADPLHVIDIRYGAIPNDTAPMWGIRLDPNAPADAHITRSTMRTDRFDRIGDLGAMLFSTECR